MRYEKLAILAISASVTAIAFAQTTTKTRPQGNIAAGKELYQQNCSNCHGVDGKGPGPGSIRPGINRACEASETSGPDGTQ